MVAFTYRMGGGIAGDVNRTHPASIEPNVNDSVNPMTFYGQAGVYSSTGTIRSLIATDTALTKISGVSVRPFPTQQSTTDQPFGATQIGNAGIGGASALDILDWGYMTVTVNGSVVKGSPVYIWIAASAGSHVQGGFEAAPTAGSTIEVSNVIYNSQPDSSGNVEIKVNI